MLIRDATPEDAGEACAVLRRSIIELCVADHHDDRAILAAWLSNKTPEIVASWIATPGNSVLVAVEDGAILAVGSVTGAGDMLIRDATPEDAGEACAVLRRSIIELCVADHHDDRAILAAWLSNETPEIVASWIATPGNSVLVAVEDGAILAVGSVTDDGEITLNYVSPAARFRGVSRALLGALEVRAIERGNSRCRLTSTETAHRFYRSAGYGENGPPQHKFGSSSSIPMSKFVGEDR